MEDLPHCVVQDCVPFGAAAEKVEIKEKGIGKEERKAEWDGGKAGEGGELKHP